MARHARTNSLANQERAYTAASRRTDRSLAARLASAEAASELHRQRTGRSFYISREIIQKDEVYEEVDDLAWRRLQRQPNAYASNTGALSTRRNNYVQDNENDEALQNVQTIQREADEAESRYNTVDALYNQCFPSQDPSSSPKTQQQELPGLADAASPPDVDYSMFLHDVAAPATSTTAMLSMPTEEQNEQDMNAFAQSFDPTFQFPTAFDNYSWEDPTNFASPPSLSWGPSSPSTSTAASASTVSPLPSPPASRSQEPAQDYMGIGAAQQFVEPVNLQLWTDADKAQGAAIEQNESAMGKMAGFGSPTQAAAMAAAVGSDWDDLWYPSGGM